MAKLIVIITGLFSLTVLSGCRYLAVLAIARSATCRVDINERRAKSSCRLINGIYFEKLNVIRIDSTGIPTEYFVNERFVLYNPGVEGVQEYWPDKVYFRKPNGHYRWSMDTVNVRYLRIDKDRQRLPVDSSDHEPGMVGFFVFSDKTFDTCPVKFTKDSWYYVSVIDPRVSSIYLYVDKKMRFTIYKFDSGVSPI